MAARISASVGRKGKNAPEDVKTVQNLLNGFASKVGFAKVKVDGAVSAKLEQAIGAFQEEVCGFKPDFRIDPGKGTIKKLAAGPAKAEAERKAQIQAIKKFIAEERTRVKAQLVRMAEQVATGGGLPKRAGQQIYETAESLIMDQFDAMTDLRDDLAKADPKDIKKISDIVLKAGEGRLRKVGGQFVAKADAVVKAITGERDRVLSRLLKLAQKQASSNGMPAQAAQRIYDEIEERALAKYDRLVDLGDDLHDATPKQVKDLADQAFGFAETAVKTVVNDGLRRRENVFKNIVKGRNKVIATLKKEALKQAKQYGLPPKAGEMLYNSVESFALERYDALADLGEEIMDTDPADIPKLADKALGEAFGRLGNVVKTVTKQQSTVIKTLAKIAQSQAKTLGLAGKSADKVLSGMESLANEQWDWFMGKQKGGGGDPSEIAKMAAEVAKSAGDHISTMMEEAARREREGASDPDAKTPLLLKGAEEGIKQGGFSFKVTGVSPDPKAKVLLIVGKPSLQIDITKGFSKANMVELFKSIDQGGLWSSTIDFYAIETTNGKPDKATKSKTVSLRAPVAPFKGTVSFAGLGADKGMTYTGNGTGRYLYTTPINGWYFMKYGPNFERDPKMRGFDCITYVGSAKKKMSGMAGRGDGLAGALGAKKVDMEGVAKDKIVEFFKGDGKSGTYIAWWKTHCIAVVGGTVHEFSKSKGGFNTKSATSYGWPASGNYVRKL